MARRQNFQTIAWLRDLRNRDLLDMDPSYQRRSVWNQSFKDYFIDTILLHYPSPAIFLFEEMAPSGRAVYHVVDGKQRLTTIFEFIGNEFPVPEKAEKTILRGKYFDQLSDDTKRELWSYQFSVEYLPTDEEGIINNVFDRINRNTARLTAQELRHAKYGGVFITAAEDLAVWMADQLSPGFPYIAPRSRRQMKDVELVAHLLLLLEVGPRGYSTTLLDEAFSERDIEWEQSEEVAERFRRTVQVLEQLLQVREGRSLAGTRLRNQTDFYSLFGAVAELMQEQQHPPLQEWASRLVEFVELVEDQSARAENESANQYYEAARSASNDTGPRRKRMSIVAATLRHGDVRPSG